MLTILTLKQHSMAIYPSEFKAFLNNADYLEDFLKYLYPKP